ncbi:hypothetical protein Sango_0580800 [Sesamum angolense]|uniref:Uncharacterized protein n=1 Tax=Sesamum angolense TaxID=2727404 RepID=A0AAE1X5Q5_9LAMI|nr:hypothetical protein Sango_0580800 [Sesamum angolense]
MWDWQGQDYDLEDNASIDISKCLLNGVNQNEDHLSCVLDSATTPVKACGELAYHATNSGSLSYQVKRRRMLQFESEVLDAPLCDDEIFLRSKETQDSLEDTFSEISEWVAGFSEGTSASSNEYLDPSSEGWIADCFKEAEMHITTEEIACNTPPEYDVKAVEKHPVHTQRNVVFKGRKSYMRTPPKLASSVVYPFTFIKPCVFMAM